MRPTVSRCVCALACVVLAMASVGCSRYGAPTLRVAEARVTERTQEGVSIDFLLEAINENEVALPLKSIEYTLTLDGRRVFRGTRTPEATLRRFGVQTLRLPVAFPLEREGARLAGETPYRLEGRIVYLTPGELADVLFDARLYRPSVSFRERGRIDFGPDASTIESVETISDARP